MIVQAVAFIFYGCSYLFNEKLITGLTKAVSQIPIIKDVENEQKTKLPSQFNDTEIVDNTANGAPQVNNGTSDNNNQLIRMKINTVSPAKYQSTDDTDHDITSYDNLVSTDDER